MPFQCVVCDRTFRKKSDLKRHLKAHIGERLFECNICKKTFILMQTLKKHNLTHTGERPFKCDVCGDCFTRNETLQTHMRIHTREKPFQCDECGKSFTTKSNLRSHKLIHTNVRPFMCDTCSKYFKSTRQLKSHMRTHGRLFRCDECGKSFKSKSGFKYHKETHARRRLLESEDSEILSNTDGDLRNHEEMQTDDGQLQCTDTFKRKDQVENQDLLHTNQKFFKLNQSGKSSLVIQGLMQNDYQDINAVSNVCEHCGKSFKFKYDLKYRHSCRFMLAQSKSVKSLKFGFKRNLRLQKPSKHFKCIVCSKAFFFRKSLLIHRYQHKRTFKCKVCLKVFLSKMSLRIHKCNIRNHTYMYVF